jgi:hypothetical protein
MQPVLITANLCFTSMSRIPLGKRRIFEQKLLGRTRFSQDGEFLPLVTVEEHMIDDISYIMPVFVALMPNIGYHGSVYFHIKSQDRCIYSN